MLIDFHTHVFPEKIAARSLEVLKAGILKCEGIHATAYTDGTVVGIQKSMTETGVDLSITMPIATKPSQTESINNFAKTVCCGNIISFATLHPQNEDIDKIMENVARSGFKGIKLHPEFQQTYIDSPETIKIFEKAEKLRLYTVIHSGADIGLKPPVHCTPDRLKNVLEYVSGKYIIAAHMGAFRMWDDVEKHLVGTEINFDTAFLNGYINPEQYKRIIKNHGADKILFGSDLPWENPIDTLNGLKYLNLDNEELEKITHKNAEKILGL